MPGREQPRAPPGDRRFTDLYHLGRRTTRTSLAAEIQHQLLPSALCCEAARFTLAAGLVPADDIGGDTYDYTLDRDNRSRPGETRHGPRR